MAENWLVLTDPDLALLTAELDPDLARHDTGIDPDEPVDVEEDLVERMSASRAKHLAHSIDPDLDRVDRLARNRPLTDLEEQLGIARRAARIATRQHGFDGAHLARQLAAAEHTARHAAVGLSVKALDRHNLGTIDSLDDRSGTVHVVFVAVDGRIGERQLPVARRRHRRPRRRRPRPVTGGRDRPRPLPGPHRDAAGPVDRHGQHARLVRR